MGNRKMIFRKDKYEILQRKRILINTFKKDILKKSIKELKAMRDECELIVMEILNLPQDELMGNVRHLSKLFAFDEFLEIYLYPMIDLRKIQKKLQKERDNE